MAEKTKQSAKKEDVQKQLDVAGYIGISSKFALLNRLITRDLNNNTSVPTFSRYTKDEISRYLSNPYRYEKQLRRAVEYIYGASPHFRRLIQYFVGLSDLSYIVEPYRIDPKKANVRIVNNNYRKVLNMLSSMNIKTQLPKILTVCLREDVFYGTLWVTSDSITIQQLPSDYCSISSIEGNVLNVTFDFSYFDRHLSSLDNYPPEFKTKYYSIYKKDLLTRWIELDSPTSFAIKCNADILDYAIPPFAGILREVYELEDYKVLKLTKTALENYAMLVMMLPMDDDGSWGIDLDKAKEFWRNLDAVLPEEVGSVLTPMPIDKISFERSNTGDIDTIADAEQSLYTAAGVSSLLFNNEKASANALLLSIKADQAITYGIVKSIGDAINRFIQSQGYGKNFHVNFLDVSPFNRKEVGDAYLKAATYGIPTISAYAASQGIGQAELDTMSFLEGEVLGLQKMFRPIQSSSQMSPSDIDSEAATEEGGAPTKDIGELTDSGEQSAEDKDDWG
ncbi:MAG: hypothetical protein J6Y20_10390 [Lachnospiraceae bacterium]|nr:hypothetical protein [Lachnospiraceae bacterium]